MIYILAFFKEQDVLSSFNLQVIEILLLSFLNVLNNEFFSFKF